MKTMVSHFGASAETRRGALDQLGESPRSFDRPSHAGELADAPADHRVADILTQARGDDASASVHPGEAHPSEGAGGAARTISDGRGAASSTGRKDSGVRAPSGGAPKFAAELARAKVVEANDAPGSARDGEPTKASGVDSAEDEFFDGELDGQELVEEAEPVVLTEELAAPAAAVGGASDGHAAGWAGDAPAIVGAPVVEVASPHPVGAGSAPRVSPLADRAPAHASPAGADGAHAFAEAPHDRIASVAGPVSPEHAVAAPASIQASPGVAAPVGEVAKEARRPSTIAPSAEGVVAFATSATVDKPGSLGTRAASRGNSPTVERPAFPAPVVADRPSAVHVKHDLPPTAPRAADGVATPVATPFGAGSAPASAGKGVAKVPQAPASAAAAKPAVQPTRRALPVDGPAVSPSPITDAPVHASARPSTLMDARRGSFSLPVPERTHGQAPSVPASVAPHGESGQRPRTVIAVAQARVLNSASTANVPTRSAPAAGIFSTGDTAVVTKAKEATRAIANSPAKPAARSTSKDTPVADAKRPEFPNVAPTSTSAEMPALAAPVSAAPVVGAPAAKPVQASAQGLVKATAKSTGENAAAKATAAPLVATDAPISTPAVSREVGVHSTNVATDVATNIATDVATDVATNVATNVATDVATKVATNLAAERATKRAPEHATEHATERGSVHAAPQAARTPSTSAPVSPSVTPLASPVTPASVAPAAPAKLTSQSLDLEHASRRRAAAVSALAARKPARAQRHAPASAFPTKTPVSSAVAPPPSPPVEAAPAGAHASVLPTAAPSPAVAAPPPGRFKLPALIPVDGGLRIASLAGQQRSASPAAHPTSPVDTNTLPPTPAVPSPRPESRRVRAAILDLVQRSGSEDSLASTASRKGFDTPSPADKGESTSARRGSRAADGAAAPAPFSAPRVVAAEFPAAPSAHAGAPVAQRRSARDEHGATAPRHPSAVAAPAHAVLPAVAAALAPSASGHPAKVSGNHGPARPVDGIKTSHAPLATPIAAESPEGARADRTAVSPSTAPPAHDAPVARASVAPSGHAPAPATTHELRSGDLSLPATSNAPRALLDQAAADPSLHAAAIGNNAHLRLETADAGSLSLHLRVRDGVADLEVEGAGARSLDLRPQEIRRALAGEGLTLGRFETRTGDADVARPQDTAVSAGSSSSQTSSNGSSGSSSHDGSPPPSPENQPSPSFSSNPNSSSSFNDGRRSWNSDGSDGRDRDARPGQAPAVGQPSSSSSATGPRRRRGFHVMA